MKHYFATDGNYGDADDILVTETDSWTEAHWELISEALDVDRIVIASRFRHGYSVDEVKEWYYNG